MRKILILLAIGGSLGFLGSIVAKVALGDDQDPRIVTYTTGVTVGPFHGGNSWPYTGTGVGWALLNPNRDPTVDDSVAGVLQDWQLLQRARVQRTIQILFQELRFAFDSAELGPDSGSALDEVARLLSENPEIWLILGGHTDLVGTAEYNLGLSRRRAEAVQQALLDRGVPASRLEVISFGEARPVDLVTGPSPFNRRVEITPQADLP